MKLVDEFREPPVLQKAAEEIPRVADPGRQYRFMEVCGGHTHAIYRLGLKDLLPPNLELVHGPGCPVCVLPMGTIDDGLSMAQDPEAFARMQAATGGRRAAPVLIEDGRVVQVGWQGRGCITGGLPRSGAPHA